MQQRCFLILFLFSSISIAQNDSEVVFGYPDYLCPDIEDVVVRLDDNEQVDLSEFLKNAKKCLDQSDYDVGEDITVIVYELETLCNDDMPSCLENVEASISEMQTNLLEYQQARILYPYSYQKVGELDEYDIEDANFILQDEEGCFCNDLFLARVLIYGDEEQHNRVMNRLKSLGTLCLRSMFNTLVLLSSGQTIPSSCQDQRDHPICIELNNNATIIQQRISSLVYSIRDTSLISSSLNSGNQNLDSLNSGGFSDFILGLKNQLDCSDYAIGEERQLEEGLNSFLTPGLKQGRRLIRRESENHYTASVAVKFTSFDFDHINSSESDFVS